MWSINDVLPEGKAIFWGHTTLVALPLVLPGIGILIAYLSIAASIWKIKQRRRILTQVRYTELQSDPDLVPPYLVTPRFSDRINFPRYRKVTVFDPDLVPSPI
eukprot:sb/3478171/